MAEQDKGALFDRLKKMDLMAMTHKERSDYLGLLYDMVRYRRQWVGRAIREFHVTVKENFVPLCDTQGEFVREQPPILFLAGIEHDVAFKNMDELLYEIERVIAFTMDHEKNVKTSLIRKLTES